MALNRRNLTGLLVAVSMPALASPAVAQSAEAADGGLEEIVVSARKRSESLLDVPVAISAISAAALERAHVSDVTQIAQMTPQLLIAPASGVSNNVTAFILFDSCGYGRRHDCC